MSQRSYQRRCIALEQLETALRLWEESEDLFSVITLAGAAEEILGRCVEASGVPNVLEDLKSSVVRMHRHLFDEELDPREVVQRSNRARNQLKHYDLGAAPHVTMDVHEEAKDMLNRAIDNFWLLENDLTPAMRRFQDDQHGPSTRDSA